VLYGTKCTVLKSSVIWYQMYKYKKQCYSIWYQMYSIKKKCYMVPDVQYKKQCYMVPDVQYKKAVLCGTRCTV
jgi:hypothetical protein